MCLFFSVCLSTTFSICPSITYLSFSLSFLSVYLSLFPPNPPFLAKILPICMTHYPIQSTSFFLSLPHPSLYHIHTLFHWFFSHCATRIVWVLITDCDLGWFILDNDRGISLIFSITMVENISSTFCIEWRLFFSVKYLQGVFLYLFFQAYNWCSVQCLQPSPSWRFPPCTPCCSISHCLSAASCFW